MNSGTWFDVPEKMNYLNINPFSFHVLYPHELKDEGKGKEQKEQKEDLWVNSLGCLKLS